MCNLEKSVGFIRYSQINIDYNINCICRISDHLKFITRYLIMTNGNNIKHWLSHKNSLRTTVLLTNKLYIVDNVCSYL